ncbi:MAG TPA: serine hydrolase [Asanoa sp.]
MTLWANIDRDLAAAPGIVSAWVGPLGGPPRYARLPDATHYAASTMKVGILVALHRSGVDLDSAVPVHNRHRSALPGGPDYANDAAEDSDTAVWARLGGNAPLRWLAERMIVRSSNLATNLCIEAVGLPAVAEVWRVAGARHSVTVRGIEDTPAREAGMDNLVTAADLAALLGGIARGTAASPAACREMLEVLLAQQHLDDLAAGLPAGVRIAHKNGWVTGVRHGAGVVFPDDAPPYAIAVCTSTELPDREACAMVARVSAAAWSARAGLVEQVGP